MKRYAMILILLLVAALARAANPTNNPPPPLPQGNNPCADNSPGCGFWDPPTNEGGDGTGSGGGATDGCQYCDPSGATWDAHCVGLHSVIDDVSHTSHWFGSVNCRISNDGKTCIMSGNSCWGYRWGPLPTSTPGMPATAISFKTRVAAMRKAVMEATLPTPESIAAMDSDTDETLAVLSETGRLTLDELAAITADTGNTRESARHRLLLALGAYVSKTGEVLAPGEHPVSGVRLDTLSSVEHTPK